MTDQPEREAPTAEERLLRERLLKAVYKPAFVQSFIEFMDGHGGYLAHDLERIAVWAIKEIRAAVLAERELRAELVDALQQYIILLEEECGEMTAFAANHNIVSQRYEQGVACRERIAVAIRALLPPKGADR